MPSPFPPTLNSFVLLLLQEAYDPNGKHMEYRDLQGTVFARMTKIYKKGAFSGLFDAFRPAQPVFAELRDAENNLLMTTLSHYGDTKRECRVDISHADGTPFGFLYDASYGADFTLPDNTLVGTARRPNDRPTEPQEGTYTLADAAGKTVGTYERKIPSRDASLWDWFDYGSSKIPGRPIQIVTIETESDPALRTFLFLFPALQNLRYSRSG